MLLQQGQPLEPAHVARTIDMVQADERPVRGAHRRGAARRPRAHRSGPRRAGRSATSTPSATTSSPSASARPAPARAGWRWPWRCRRCRPSRSTASSSPGPRSRPASGSASCPATSWPRSTRTCGRSTTPSTTWSSPRARQRLLERGTVEVAPLAFMRGRTLNSSFIILDEAQNTTPEQMKMFLTRIGFGSKVVVTGDTTQVDVPGGRSGLDRARAGPRRHRRPRLRAPRQPRRRAPPHRAGHRRRLRARRRRRRPTDERPSDADPSVTVGDVPPRSTSTVFVADEQDDHPRRPRPLGARSPRRVLDAEGVGATASCRCCSSTSTTIAELNRALHGRRRPDRRAVVPDRRRRVERPRPDAGGRARSSRRSRRRAAAARRRRRCAPRSPRATRRDHAGTYDDELALLVVHGILHVLGHDHAERRGGATPCRPASASCSSGSLARTCAGDAAGPTLSPRRRDPRRRLGGADVAMLVVDRRAAAVARRSSRSPRRRSPACSIVKAAGAGRRRSARGPSALLALVDAPERFLNPVLLRGARRASSCRPRSPASSPTGCSGRSGVVIGTVRQRRRRASCSPRPRPRPGPCQHPERAALASPRPVSRARRRSGRCASLSRGAHRRSPT